MIRLLILGSALIFVGCGKSDEGGKTFYKPVPGPQGEIGSKGDSGEDGTQGIDGKDGEQGEAGLSGSTGESGSDGAQGVQGEQGVQGIQGEMGLQGPQGVSGDVGDQGDIGSQGIQGVSGDQGIQGVTGSQGVQGVQGLTGDNATADAVVIDLDPLLVPLEDFNKELIDVNAVIVLPMSFEIPSQPKNGKHDWLMFKLGNTILCYKGKNRKRLWELNHRKTIGALDTCSSELNIDSGALFPLINVQKDDIIQIIPETTKLNGVITTFTIPYIGIQE